MTGDCSRLLLELNDSFQPVKKYYWADDQNIAVSDHDPDHHRDIHNGWNYEQRYNDKFIEEIEARGGFINITKEAILEIREMMMREYDIQ